MSAKEVCFLALGHFLTFCLALLDSVLTLLSSDCEFIEDLALVSGPLVSCSLKPRFGPYVLIWARNFSQGPKTTLK